MYERTNKRFIKKQNNEIIGREHSSLDEELVDSLKVALSKYGDNNGKRNT